MLKNGGGIKILDSTSFFNDKYRREYNRTNWKLIKNLVDMYIVDMYIAIHI